MDERLSVALEDCRARLARGESVAACLAAHPEHAEELLPLLTAALQLRTLRREPNAVYTAASRARFHGHLAEAQAARRAASSGLRPREWLRRLALPAGVAAVLIGSGFGLVTAAADALPNSPLYGVQQAHEQVAGYLARTPGAQSAYHLRLANQRLQQLKNAHAVDAGPAVVEQLTAGMVQQTTLAAQGWSTVPPAEQAKLSPKVRALLAQERVALQWEAAHEPPRVAEQASQREAQLRAAADRLLIAAIPAAGEAADATPSSQEYSAVSQRAAFASAVPAAPSRPKVAVQPSRRLRPVERVRRFLAAHRPRPSTPPPVHTPTP